MAEYFLTLSPSRSLHNVPPSLPPPTHTCPLSIYPPGKNCISCFPHFPSFVTNKSLARRECVNGIRLISNVQTKKKISGYEILRDKHDRRLLTHGSVWKDCSSRDIRYVNFFACSPTILLKLVVKQPPCEQAKTPKVGRLSGHFKAIYTTMCEKN